MTAMLETDAQGGALDASPFRIGLAVVTAVGAAWRLLYLFAAKIDDELLLNDSIYYSIQAGRNSEGDWFREGLTNLPGAEHGPLTSLYLTPWSLGPGDNVAWQRFAMTLLGIATVALIGVLGRRLAGPRVGLVAAAIAAVYPNLWINDSLVMSESLAILLVTLSLLVTLQLARAPSKRLAVLLGVLVGLGALTRSEVALFAAGFALLAWWRADERGGSRLVRPALVLGAALLTVSPWLAYNVSRFERPVLMSTNDGTTLLGANCPTTYYGDIGGWDIRCLEPVPTDESVDASIRAERRRDLAVEYVRDNVRRVPIVVVARVGRLLDVYMLSSLVALDTGEEKAEWAVWAGIVMWWGLAVLAVVGWRRLRRAAEEARDRWWLVVPLVTVVITTVLFYGAHRLRAPAEPVIVVLAATGLVALLDGRTEPHQHGGAAADG